jgi:hypothetical protein
VAAAGLAVHERRRDADRGGFAVRVVDPLDQQSHGGHGDLGDRLDGGGDGRVDQFGPFHVVVRDHGQVGADPQAEAAGGTHDAEQYDAVGGDHGGRRCGQREQAGHLALGGRRRPTGDEFGVPHQFRPAQTQPVAEQAFRRGADRGGAGDHGDPAVAEFAEVADEIGGGLHVLGADLVVACVLGHPVEQHGGDAQPAQFGQDTFGGAHGGGEEHAVDAAGAQRAQGGLLRVGFVVGVGEDQRVAGGGGRGLHGGDKRLGVRVPCQRQGETEGSRAAGDQRARDGVTGVAGLLDGGQHPVPGVGGDRSGVVDDV